MERNQNFNDYQFPVDVLVMDIQWADQDSQEAGYEYFKFSSQNFTTEGHATMNAGRYMTTIFDPHIKVRQQFKGIMENYQEQDLKISNKQTNMEKNKLI